MQIRKLANSGMTNSQHLYALMLCGLFKKYLTFSQEKYIYTAGGLQP